jgi:hypothetical protein
VERSELPEVHGIDVGAVVDEQLRHLKVSVGAGVVQGHQPALVLQLQNNLKSQTKIIQKLRKKATKFFYYNSWVQKEYIRSISQCFGSGSRRAKMTHKNRKSLETCFEVLDVLFRGLKVSPVAWKSLMAQFFIKFLVIKTMDLEWIQIRTQ